LIIDIHIHSSEYSLCSTLKLEDAIIKAKTLGLDGICITDHDSNGIRDKARILSKKHDFLIIVGMEYYTYDGELLIFGLDEIPRRRMHAGDMLQLVSGAGGVAIVAHPFRDKVRSMGEYLMKLNGVAGVEVLNGETGTYENYLAYAFARGIGLPCLGGSDAHTNENVGKYATIFPDGIEGGEDLIEAIQKRTVSPALYDPKEGRFKELEWHFSI
jgi:predicted metal-dependent phosphoesterase TrpH